MELREFKTRAICQKNVMVESLKVRSLERVIARVADGVVYHLVTQKAINPYTFLLQAVALYGCIEELYIATYRVSAKTADNFRYMLDAGLIKDFTLVVNDNYEVLMKHKAATLLDMDRERQNFRLIQRNSHAKVTLIRNGNNHMVISGSGNYSTNPQIEQYTITRSQDLYDFHREWMLHG